MAEAGTGAAELCCISHEFDRAARRNSGRLAVIHAAASGGDGEERRFTCGDLLAAVASLSRRIAAALAGPSSDPRERSGASTVVPARSFVLLVRPPFCNFMSDADEFGTNPRISRRRRGAEGRRGARLAVSGVRRRRPRRAQVRRGVPAAGPGVAGGEGVVGRLRVQRGAPRVVGWVARSPSCV